ncbi:hypothetical protein NQ318_008326 [Aromia moschata]|uniref:Uncharacterized protein n=1 Tax=Aromia moschata TaxID=1265417 RepID=A0AAV8XVR8_9CUCU|nr:hypothetical protein NQ318_008326 [Aromia moschata]
MQREPKRCLESCYWHLIEKRFCFDDSIALYKDPQQKEEKNNNMFENMAFYDSVSVIAGRAIVTIDPLPEKTKEPVVQQPRRLKWQEVFSEDDNDGGAFNNIPSIVTEKSGDESTASHDSEEKMIEDEEKVNIALSVEQEINHEEIRKLRQRADKNQTGMGPGENTAKSITHLNKPDPESRKKSLMERRMSRSLYLKIDFPKEVPIIRQNSVPKFFLDTPERNQTESTLVKSPLTSLTSPMVKSSEFSYDLYSVVQMEKIKSKSAPKEIVPIHRSPSRLSQIKGKIKLRKSKSTVSSSNIPHSNYI